MANIIFGNNKTAGFVNLVFQNDAGKVNRIVIGTGKRQDGEFKESVTVFFHEKYDGHVPAKGEYVEVSGDLSVGPRRDKPEQYNGTMNIRFANQLEKKEAPQKRAEAPANAGADDI